MAKCRKEDFRLPRAERTPPALDRTEAWLSIPRFTVGVAFLNVGEVADCSDFYFYLLLFFATDDTPVFTHTL